MFGVLEMGGKLFGPMLGSGVMPPNGGSPPNGGIFFCKPAGSENGDVGVEEFFFFFFFFEGFSRGCTLLCKGVNV